MQTKGSILITGAMGLIGSLLSQQLKNHNISVIDFDKCSSQTGECNVHNKVLLRQLIQNCSGIVHLAAVSRVVWGQQNPALCWEVNVEGTRNILELAYRATHKPWVIFASSREVYGQQERFPVSENAPLRPLNLYARSKVAGEELVNEYRECGLTTAILRFSSVYGSAYDHADRVIPAFCRLAVTKQALRIDGFQNLFDFTHVEDVVAGILAVIHQLHKGKNNLPPIHFTTGRATSLLDVALLIEQILGESIEYYPAPPRNYDVHHFYGDPLRAKNLLGWESKINLSQGLADMLKKYQMQLAINNL